jgi:aspartyl-tRNA(Asn)/glutamyl-tRNA(Gln) amidotransferase subunit A
MSFSFTSIPQYHQQLQSGAITCAAAVEHFLLQIEANKHLNALVAVFEQEARKQAEMLDASVAAGNALLPLHGVVIAIKDVICIKDQPVRAASNMLKGFRSLYTATAVQRLLDAGAIIIGTCNCDEFAMGSSNENSAYGPALNAADTTKVPGGSSGGSAVAVQAGLCMLSLGSDTGGSVRQPADFCGVVGLKPGYGRISRYGLIAYGSSFDCIGVFGKTVSDVAMVFETMAGHDPLDATSGTQPVQHFSTEASDDTKYRFAFFESTLTLPGLDPEIRSAFENMLKKLRSEGHTVESVPFDLLDFIVPTYYVLTTAEATSNLSRYDGVRYGHRSATETTDLTEFYKHNRSEGFGAEVKRRIMLGNFVLSSGFYDAYFTKAQQVRQLLSSQTAAVFSSYNALLMPVSPTTAFTAGSHSTDPIAMYLADIYTVFANLTGIPGMAIPLFRHTNGMPFGLQVMTNQWDELTLHRICYYLESLFAKDAV